ncbi:CopM family metallochaperone [Pseudotabrizicola alkalilacus]|uniref:DUF305 domain-containing protein n=1 Tax=Pseudotabrizicola alkalilacus TaxID=2305252 RepID=A0A411Z1N9_9RHOB|nr:DUF305 domain-containing protein [Pseudotabrizicola alkalilacus]RGP36960.1 DUF305 domain-containing protein [Pseudotabrizicola alkalilacus]
MKTPLFALLTLTALAAAPALAQMDHSGHGAAHNMDSPSSAAYAEANARMHSAMTIPLTGNADVDFIAGMIPHHQGAVDMARIVLEHGTDPEVRKLAEAVIVAQEAEIAWMTEWLAANSK